MAQSKFSTCKSQPGITFSNTVPLQLTKQDQLVRQGLTGYRGSPAEVSSAFHIGRDNLVSMLFFLSSEDLGYSREVSKNESINFCWYSSKCLVFFLKGVEGSGCIGCVMAHFPKLCFLTFHSQKRAARLEGDKNNPHITEQATYKRNYLRKGSESCFLSF